MSVDFYVYQIGNCFYFPSEEIKKAMKPLFRLKSPIDGLQSWFQFDSIRFFMAFPK